MPKQIALVDCNNFFVSCERVFRPDLAGRPVVVLSSNDGCVISRSNEAKALGIRMGEPWFRIKEIPRYRDTVVFSSNFPLYADLSNRVKEVLSTFSPVQEMYSVDESFLDWTGFKDTRHRAFAVREAVWRKTGIPVCVGIGPTKTLAKLANFVAKKHPKSKGVFLYDALSEKQQEKLLACVPVEEIWGIGRRLNDSLTSLGIATAAQLRRADAKTLRARYGVTMERLILELRGVSCLDLTETAPPRKQILSSRSFGTAIYDKADIQNALAFHATRVAGELRKQGSVAGLMQVFLSTNRFRQDKPQYHPCLSLPFAIPTNNTIGVTQHAMKALDTIFRSGYAYKKAGVSVSALLPESACTRDMFTDPRKSRLMKVIDDINDRFGNGTLRISMNDLKRSWTPKHDRLSRRYTSNWDEIAETDRIF